MRLEGSARYLARALRRARNHPWSNTGNHIEIARKVIMKQPSLAEQINFSPDHLRDLQQMARNFFATGSFAKAEQIYRFLVNLDAKNFDYLAGLGGSALALQDYRAAILTAIRGMTLSEGERPDFVFMQAEAMLGLGERKMAEHGYRLVLSMASDDPRQKHFIEGAGKRLAMMGRPAEPLLPPPAKKVRATRRYAGGFKLGGYTKSETIEKL